MRAIIITLMLYSIPTIASSCGLGMVSGDYAGSKACYTDGKLMQIEGSLTNCPAGFMRSSDQWGIGVCTDGKITTYETCQPPFFETVNQYGQPTCVDVQNNPIIELIPTIY